MLFSTVTLNCFLQWRNWGAGGGVSAPGARSGAPIGILKLFINFSLRFDASFWCDFKEIFPKKFMKINFGAYNMFSYYELSLLLTSPAVMHDFGAPLSHRSCIIWISLLFRQINTQYYYIYKHYRLTKLHILTKSVWKYFN